MSNVYDITELHQEQSEIAQIKEAIAELEVENGQNKEKIAKIDEQLKSASKAMVKTLQRNRKSTDELIKSNESVIAELKDAVAKLEDNDKKTAEATETEKHIQEILEKYNAYYITSDRKWRVVIYPYDPDKMEIDAIDPGSMVERIMTERDIDPPTVALCIRVAARMNRVGHHFEHSGEPTDLTIPAYDRPLNITNIYKQYWLKPIYDVEPDAGFDVLIGTISGGLQDYIDQFERTVAIRYCQPDKVVEVNNIDSCGKGGTGRDTIVNIFRMIWTKNCVREASTETFNGNFNSEVEGAIWLILNEKGGGKGIDFETYKSWAGSDTVRMRDLNKKPRDIHRMFTMFFPNNLRTGVIPAVGGSTGGASNEDRRTEWFIANRNLRDTTRAWLIANEYFEDPTDDEVDEQIHYWQKNVFRNKQKVAEWLGYIIKKHDAYNIKDCWPIHGQHYQSMVDRQIDTFAHFMKSITESDLQTNTYPVEDFYTMYQAIAKTKLGKTNFQKDMAAWLTKETGEEWKVDTTKYYDQENNPHKRNCVFNTAWKNTENQHEPGYVKLFYDFEEYIDPVKIDQNRNEPYGVKFVPDTILERFK